MKPHHYILFILLGLLGACNSDKTAPPDEAQEHPAPREATDPVPEPTDSPDSTSGAKAQAAKKTAGTQEVHYQVSGNEPFWSLSIGRPYSTYRSMEGDSLSFAYTEPKHAAGRQEEWVQLFELGNNNWVLLRRGNSPCSDGMSDREHAYTATVWLNGQLLDGCANSQSR